MDDNDPERHITGPHQNDHNQNDIASYLKHQKHAAGAHDDQLSTNRAHTNNNQDVVQTFDKFQPVNIGLTIMITCVTRSSLTELLNKKPNQNQNIYLFECHILRIIVILNIPGTSGA